jgi:PAS domain S-box-containing protein
VTERSPRIRWAMEPREELLAAILDAIPDPIFVKDKQLRYVAVNDAFLALTGRGATRVLGLTDADLLPAEVAVRYLETDREVLRGATIELQNDRYVDPDQRERVFATTKVPLRDAEGRIAYVLGMVHEITRLEAARDALRAANESLEKRVEERTEALRGAQQELLRKERLAVLGQLAGGLAHQIRNPLGAISNAAAVLKRKIGEGASPDAQQALAVIREEVFEANRIITDLLDYARIRPPSLAPVAVSTLVDAALALVAPGDGIELQRDVDAALRVQVDERQMRDVLGNVLRNAIEAMPEGGTLTIEARPDGAHVTIAIADTGPGISRSSLQDLFEPLVTSKPLGLGLGLATAKALVENHRGSIRCASTPGSGARFEIRVPAATDEE